MPEFEFQSDWDEARRGMSERLREIRRELYGEHGGPMLAEELRVPFSSWVSYESGASMPAPVMLRFLEQTGTNPGWLLTGEGSRYSPRRAGS